MQKLEEVIKATSHIILGKEKAIRLSVACMLARGHLLIEDTPGVGKTTLSHTLAKVMGLSYQRIQFTSDLLPADILGVSVYNRDSNQCFQTSSLPMRSTAPHPEHKVHCWRPWRNSRSPLREKRATWPIPFRDCNTKPDQPGGDIPSARIATGSLPDAYRSGLPGYGSRARIVKGKKSKRPYRGTASNTFRTGTG